MARQNLRLLGLGVCMFSVLAMQDEQVQLDINGDPTRLTFNSTAGMGKPRPHSSDGEVNFLPIDLERYLLQQQDLGQQDGPGRRTGIITKVQDRGLSIMVLYPNAGESVEQRVHTRDGWSFGEYFQNFDAFDGDKPIKGDIVKFTVIDASNETSRGEKRGRVKAANVVKIGVLTLEEREQLAKSHGYEMSHEPRRRHQTCGSIGKFGHDNLDWNAARSETCSDVTTSASSHEADEQFATWLSDRQSARSTARRGTAPAVTQEAAGAWRRDAEAWRQEQQEHQVPEWRRQVPRMTVAEQMRQPNRDQKTRGSQWTGKCDW